MLICTSAWSFFKMPCVGLNSSSRIAVEMPIGTAVTKQTRQIAIVPAIAGRMPAWLAIREGEPVRNCQVR